MRLCTEVNENYSFIFKMIIIYKAMFPILSWQGRPKGVTGPSGYCVRKFAAMATRFV
jgi:hypothetical protein